MNLVHLAAKQGPHVQYILIQNCRNECGHQIWEDANPFLSFEARLHHEPCQQIVLNTLFKIKLLATDYDLH